MLFLNLGPLGQVYLERRDTAQPWTIERHRDATWLWWGRWHAVWAPRRRGP